MKAESQSLQETVSLATNRVWIHLLMFLQIDSLQRQLQLTSQNTQYIQDELDDVKTMSLTEEADMLEKLKKISQR